MHTLKINEKLHQVDFEDDMPLLWILRDELGKTGLIGLRIDTQNHI